MALETWSIPSLVVTVNHGDNLTSLESEQAEVSRSLPAHQAVIVNHRTRFFAYRAGGSVPLQDFYGFTHGSDRHLSRPGKALTQLICSKATLAA